jgi:hypothetical protein
MKLSLPEPPTIIERLNPPSPWNPAAHATLPVCLFTPGYGHENLTESRSNPTFSHFVDSVCATPEGVETNHQPKNGSWNAEMPFVLSNVEA